MKNIGTRKWYDTVPKDFQANLAFRAARLAEARTSVAVQNREIKRCEEDVLYFINVYVWTLDPRSKIRSDLPFITYPFQDDTIELIAASINNQDLIIEKSRDMGASWMVLTVFYWVWTYQKNRKFLLISRDQSLVDKRDDDDCLFAKLDFLMNHLPSWLKPKLRKNDRKRNNLKNPESGSTISGSSTNKHAGRAGRSTAILDDEAAFYPGDRDYSILKAQSRNTNSRIIVSTHHGTGTAFYKICQEGKIAKKRLRWVDHPTFSKGLYYNAEGKARSPWYDEQERRAVHPLEMAQEIDCDPLASDYQFFEGKTILTLKKRFAIQPFAVGEFEPITKTFTPDPAGETKIWFNMVKGQPPKARYAVANDISHGSGASNSVTAAVNLDTGEKVLEFASSHIKPEAYAHWTVSLCEWLYEAFLIWDAGGPGSSFGGTVMDIGYRNVYWKQDEEKLVKKPTDKPGFHLVGGTDGGPRLRVITEFRRALTTCEYTERSDLVFDECLEYVHRGDTVEHSKASSIDPTGAGASHGDRVIASALAWHAFKKRGAYKNPIDKYKKGELEIPAVIPPDCIYAKMVLMNQRQTGNYSLA